MRYLTQTFDPRELPEMIDIAGEIVAGPFCVHCGNPLSLHSGHKGGPRCPDRQLHPLFPTPNLPRTGEH